MKTTTPISATGQAITAGVGAVTRIIVTTHSSGVIKLVDSPNGTSGRAILDDFTLPTGAQILDLGESEYYEGVHFVLISGSATVQLVYIPN